MSQAGKKRGPYAKTRAKMASTGPAARTAAAPAPSTPPAEPSPSTPPPGPGGVDFRKVVEDSAKAISFEQGNVAPAAPATGAGEPAPSEVVTPPSLAPFLKTPVQFVSKIPAVRYQIPELAFDDAEAAATAEALDQVVQAFVPDISKMSPQTASVIGACSVIGSIGFQKYIIFKTKTAERRILKATTAAAGKSESEPSPPPPPGEPNAESVGNPSIADIFGPPRQM